MTTLNPDHNDDEQYDDYPELGDRYPEPEFQSMSVDVYEDGSVNTITVFIEYLDIDHETDIGVRFEVMDGVACHQTKVVNSINSDLNELYAIIKAEDHLRGIIERFPSNVNEVERLEDAFHARMEMMRMEMSDAGYL